jgi:hypothetical protein
VCDGQQRIVDQAKAQGNAWDTGVVPGHRQMVAEFHHCRGSGEARAAAEL